LPRSIIEQRASRSGKAHLPERTGRDAVREPPAFTGQVAKHTAVHARGAVSQKPHAMMPLGYQYVAASSGAQWTSGAYEVAYTAFDRNNRKVVYRGTVHVG
jgi:hypothetical protein